VTGRGIDEARLITCVFRLFVMKRGGTYSQR
jgi:hypothetical protein